MTLKNIEIFLAIVKQESISGAARMLHYTHPTVSESLKQLEKELGVQLVIRDRGIRKIVLTPAGKAFIPLAEQYIGVEQNIQQFIQAQRKKVFRLAASSASHEYMVSDITHKIMLENPDLELQLVLWSNSRWDLAVESQAFDAAIYFGTLVNSPLISKIPFYEEDRYLLCPADTVLPDRPLTPEDIDPNFEIACGQIMQPSFYEWFQQSFPSDSKPRIRVPEWMAVHKYLTDPRCWALAPAGIALQLVSRRPNSLTIRHLAAPPPPRRCTLLVSNSYPDSAVVQSFIRCCGEYVAERPYLRSLLP